MIAYDLGVAYGKAFIDGGCDKKDIITDFGEACVQDDFIMEMGITQDLDIDKEWVIKNMFELEAGMNEALKCLK